jgi:hypothetical protein
MNYGPSKKTKEHQPAFNYFLPHLMWIRFFGEHFETLRGTNHDYLALYIRLIQSSVYQRGQNR